MEALSKNEKNEARSLLSQWDEATAAVRRLLAGAGRSESGFDVARLREAIDLRIDAENALLSFWGRRRT